VLMKHKANYDDALDAFGVHGIGGAWGALLTGVAASKVWNPDGQDGLLAGNTQLFVEQLIGVLATAVYSVAVTWVLLKVVAAIVGLRVEDETEREGLDGVLHGEEGYIFAGGGRSAQGMATVHSEHSVQIREAEADAE